MSFTQTKTQVRLIAAAGSTSTVHWATRVEGGRLWSLCSTQAPLNVARTPEADCVNCMTIADDPETVSRRERPAVRAWVD